MPAIRLLKLSACVAGAGMLFACGSPQGAPGDAPAAEKADAPVAPPVAAPAPVPAPSTAPAQALPPIDTADAQQFVQGASTLAPLDFDRSGSTTVKGTVRGYDAPVYA